MNEKENNNDILQIKDKLNELINIISELKDRINNLEKENRDLRKFVETKTRNNK